MINITAVCDKCKKEETQSNRSYFDESANGWQEILIKISQYESKKYLLCKKCRGELGLIKEVGAKDVKVESVEEKLFAVICEIVAGELENKE